MFTFFIIQCTSCFSSRRKLQFRYVLFQNGDVEFTPTSKKLEIPWTLTPRQRPSTENHPDSLSVKQHALRGGNYLTELLFGYAVALEL